MDGQPEPRVLHKEGMFNKEHRRRWFGTQEMIQKANIYIEPIGSQKLSFVS